MPNDAREPAREAAGAADRDVRRVTLPKEGPLLVEGPVEVRLEDGGTATSDRFCVALCMCRRSRRYPWCDTSHRRRSKR
ncbi:CDGSH iron-sulfur domain-containing protein [Streptomyces sp. Ru73]|uniref:CDGSH iron-sulfur domain-containing protein n=1 Tax=Streptomyces sp. Ru73 TaxID=2080748 RepID=UPI000CDD12F7|nr:CDGSH iron-sulfur domain-containing protein [Streptomyces sp. Ru73]POX43438.1 CDGSH iron-sulfur domain-containing protein [Streptomyces sp. Ru73]